MSDDLIKWVRSIPDPTKNLFTDNERTLILKCYELADEIERLKSALHEIEIINYTEGKDAVWRAAHMNGVAYDALSKNKDECDE
jgi:hypothetical protein